MYGRRASNSIGEVDKSSPRDPATIYHPDWCSINPGEPHTRAGARQCPRAVMVWSYEKWWWHGLVKNENLEGEKPNGGREEAERKNGAPLRRGCGNCSIHLIRSPSPSDIRGYKLVIFFAIKEVRKSYNGRSQGRNNSDLRIQVSGTAQRHGQLKHVCSGHFRGESRQ